MTMSRQLVFLVGLAGLLWGPTVACPADDPAPAATTPVSYYRQVLPILQANCQGCHQPAKASGGYVMTTFDRLVAGGESGTAAIVPGKPDESYLLEMITPQDGQAEMPAGKPPLSAEAVAVDSAVDCRGRPGRFPADGARLRPAASANLCVAAGDHVDRLLSGRPVLGRGRFSRSAVAQARRERHRGSSGRDFRAHRVGRVLTRRQTTGGGRRPAARSGELQVWNVEMPSEGTSNWQPSLLLSIPVTGDTVYGGSWSPDGKLVAIGCADNSVRAFDAESGQQVLFQGAHSDWVLDTVFSVDGSHLISVGRDMAAKLTEVGTERFVDNITSITPGALKGGFCRSPVIRRATRS